MPDAAPTLVEEIDSVVAWWNAAGVDCDFTDDATAWLSGSAGSGSDASERHGSSGSASSPNGLNPDRHREPPPAAVRADLLGDSPPSNLTEFHDFWLNAPGLDAIGPRGRVPPRGEAKANLMVLVVEPEDGDTDKLLSGSQGRLLTHMLNAMGLTEDEVYVASALPRPTPMADTAAIAAAGMDAVTAYHVKLAAPQRVIAFGSNILPLIGHELPKDPLSLREINLVNSPVPLLVSEGLDSLMAMPRLKARFWRRWMEWSVVH